MKIIFQGYTVNETTLKDILLIWAKPIKLYWYLYDLAIFYLLFSLPAVFKADWRKMVCLLATATALSQCITSGWFQVKNCSYYALFFYLGISNKRYPNRLIGNKGIAIASFVVSMLLCAVFWDRVPYNDAKTHFSLNSVPVANAVIALGISLFLWYLFQHVKLLSTNRILIGIGRYSWEIYVIHGIVSPAFRAIVSRMSLIGPYASVAINTVLCIVLPMAFSLCCKRLGVHELLFRPVNALNKMKAKQQKA